MAENPMKYYNFSSLLPGWTNASPGGMRAKQLIHNLQYLQKGDKGEIPIEQRFTFIAMKDACVPQAVSADSNEVANAPSFPLSKCLNYPTVL
jgi:hypothetical protein